MSFNNAKQQRRHIKSTLTYQFPHLLYCYHLKFHPLPSKFLQNPHNIKHYCNIVFGGGVGKGTKSFRFSDSNFPHWNINLTSILKVIPNKKWSLLFCFGCMLWVFDLVWPSYACVLYECLHVCKHICLCRCICMYIRAYEVSVLPLILLVSQSILCIEAGSLAETVLTPLAWKIGDLHIDLLSVS